MNLAVNGVIVGTVVFAAQYPVASYTTTEGTLSPSRLATSLP